MLSNSGVASDMEMRGVTPPKKLLMTGQVMLARRDDLQVEGRWLGAGEGILCAAG